MQVRLVQTRRQIAGVEAVAGAYGVEDLSGYFGGEVNALAINVAQRTGGAQLHDQVDAGFEQAGDTLHGKLQILVAGDAHHLQLVDQQVVAMAQPAFDFLMHLRGPAFRRPAGIQRYLIAASRGFGQQLTELAAQVGQQEWGGEQRNAAGGCLGQVRQHEGGGQVLQMPAAGEEGALAIGVHQADRHGGVAGAGLQLDADAGQLQQQPLGQVIVADGADQARAQPEMAGGEGGVGRRTTGTQLAARQQLFGADLGPTVQRAQNQVHADVADDAELGLIVLHGATIVTPIRHCQ
ncbi:hypothetical protein D3C71_1279020 [compost metagenome]